MSKPRLLDFSQGLLVYPFHKTFQPESGLLGIFSSNQPGLEEWER